MRNLPPATTALRAAALLGVASLAGCETGNEVDVPIGDLPPAVAGAVLTAYPGATLQEAEREDGKGVTTYDVELMHDGREVEVKVSADGTIVEVDD